MFRIWLSIAVAASRTRSRRRRPGGPRRAPRRARREVHGGIVEQKIANQYDLAWQSLYPPHQRVASRRLRRVREPYAAGEARWSRSRCCAASTSASGSQAASRKVMTRALRMRVAVAVPQLPFPIMIDQTFHAIAVAGTVEVVLQLEQFCGANAPLRGERVGTLATGGVVTVPACWPPPIRRR